MRARRRSLAEREARDKAEKEKRARENAAWDAKQENARSRGNATLQCKRTAAAPENFQPRKDDRQWSI